LDDDRYEEESIHHTYTRNTDSVTADKMLFNSTATKNNDFNLMEYIPQVSVLFIIHDNHYHNFHIF
jgi:hypothetical protein